MIASFDVTFDKHEETVRRAEERYALLQALKDTTPATVEMKPRRRLSTLLRRIAGSPAAA